MNKGPGDDRQAVVMTESSAQSHPAHDSRYDEALERLHAYGPECFNGFTNHAPMAVEALAMLGMASEIGPRRMFSTERKEVLATGCGMNVASPPSSTTDENARV